MLIPNRMTKIQIRDFLEERAQLQGALKGSS